MSAKEIYQFFWFCVKTITSAPSLIVLVLKPLPSDKQANNESNSQTLRYRSHMEIRKKSTKKIHCPMKASDCLSENPKLMQHLRASGSIPPPSSWPYKTPPGHYWNVSTNWIVPHLFVLLNLQTLHQQWGTTIPWVCEFINTNKCCTVIHLTENMQQNKPKTAFMLIFFFFQDGVNWASSNMEIPHQ